jgi:hypothetical protein
MAGLLPFIVQFGDKSEGIAVVDGYFLMFPVEDGIFPLLFGIFIHYIQASVLHREAANISRPQIFE